MARNDTVLLDGIIEERISEKNPSADKAEVFEYLAFEQILKEYDLSYDEIEYGWVDGRDDGGIDGFFIFVNGHLLQDVDEFVWPKKGSELKIWIITCKHHDTYKQATLDSLTASISELFDFRIESSSLKGSYSSKILSMRNVFLLAYKKLSVRLSRFDISFAYVSRGDTNSIGDSIVNRSRQICNIASESFGECEVGFYFIGSKELVELYRKTPNFSLELPFIESLSRGERYVIIVNLLDYYKFISMEDGTLRRYLFDSNVRDFMGMNSVNEDISTTLNNGDSPDFWLLNNGITILATSASLIGKSIGMEDIQIVNGLQTSESIYRFFDSGGKDINERAVLVKVIVSKDDVIRDSIIRATNNQTAVEQSSLHATDKIQRDIEDVLIRVGYYYDRRKNYYKNLGISVSDIISPMYLATGYINLVMKQPFQASKFRAKSMRQQGVYDTIFSEKIPINVWPKIAFILRATDEFLNTTRVRGASEGFLRNWRHLVSFVAISIKFGRFNFNTNDLISMDNTEFSSSYVSDAWEIIVKLLSEDVISRSVRVSRKRMLSILNLIEIEKGISGIELVEKYNNVYDCVSDGGKLHKKKSKPNEEFVERLLLALPAQPWKPKMHFEVKKMLGCSQKEYTEAINKLVERGVIYKQVDGVLYDKKNEVVGFDSDRVDPITLKLY